MAYQQVEHIDLAHRWLTKAQKQAEKDLQEMLNWQVQWQIESIRVEAVTLIRGKTTDW